MSPVLWATLIYIAILVAVLAVGLIMIAWRLSMTAKAIGEIHAALGQAEANTRPLGDSVGTINGALSALSDGLKSVYGHLIRADSALGRIIAKLRASAA